MENRVVERWTRYEESLHWRVHHAYYQQRGAGAWTEHEIPYQSTSNIAHGRRLARIFCALVEDRADRGPLWLLEVGAGSGHFAASFLRALRTLAPEIAARTTYIASDYSAKSLRDLAASKHLASDVEAAHVRPALFDVATLGSLRTLAGDPLDLPAGAAFSLVIANYVCSAIAMTPLQKQDGAWSELWLEAPAQNTSCPVEELATRKNALAAMPLTGDWHRLTTDLTSRLGPFHAAVVQDATTDMPSATVFYPRRYFDFLRGIEPLARGALMVTSDYGTVNDSGIRGHFDRLPQHYGNSFGQSLVFALFDPFAVNAGFDVVRSDGELDNVHVAVAARERIGPRVREVFDAGRIFGRTESDTLLDFAISARALAERGDGLAALRSYFAYLAIDPDNPRMHYELADVALTEQRGVLARTHLLLGQVLDPDAFDWDFMLGRAHFLCGDLDLSRQGYERSLLIGPHPQTYLNLGAVHRNQQRFVEALCCFREALALDPTEERAVNGIADMEQRLEASGRL